MRLFPGRGRSNGISSNVNDGKQAENREYSRVSLVTYLRVDHLNGRTMIPIYDTSIGHSKYSIKQGKGKKHKL